jgi:hypothetical protein
MKKFHYIVEFKWIISSYVMNNIIRRIGERNPNYVKRYSYLLRLILICQEIIHFYFISIIKKIIPIKNY